MAGAVGAGTVGACKAELGAGFGVTWRRYWDGRLSIHTALPAACFAS